MNSLCNRAVVAAVLAMLTIATAHADVDVEIPNNAVVKGTLSPADESETLRVDLPRGAALTIIAKGKKANGVKGAKAPAVRIAVLDKDDSDIAAGKAAESSKGAKLKKLEIPESGSYRIVISGDGVSVGDYQAKVKWKSPKKFTETVDTTAGDQPVAFAVDAGALVTFSAKSAKGSPATPFMRHVDDAADARQVDFTPPAGGSRSHTEKKVALSSTGDFVLTVGDPGGGGPVKVTLKVKAPKAKSRTLSLTSKEIGGPGGADARGTIIFPTGGELNADDGSLPDLLGVSLLVPAGALFTPTALVFGTAPTITTGVDADLSPAGPAVFFGPDGLQFAADVTVALPFTVGTIDDPSLVRVFERNSKGKVNEVAQSRLSVDLVRGIVTFKVSHFTVFQVFGPKPVPVRADLNGDGFGDVIVSSAGDSALGFDDSIFVFFGGPGLADGTSDDADAIFISEASNSGRTAIRFGVSFTTGDVNGDGIEDLIITSAEAKSNPLGDADGAVYVFFGGQGFSGSNDVRSDADVLITGIESEIAVGGLVAVGDVTGGDDPDLIVTATKQVDDSDVILVFEGGSSLRSGNSATADVVLDLAGDTTNGFGVPNRGLAVGDVSGDGRADIVVSVVHAASRDIVAFFGGATLTSKDQAAADVIITRADTINPASSNVALGDFDGDGTDDVFFSAPAPNFMLQILGFRGGPGLASLPQNSPVPDFQFTPDNDAGVSTGFGSRLVLADIDGDGDAESIVADSNYNAGSFGTGGGHGAAFVFAGGTGTTSADATGAAAVVTGAFGRVNLGRFLATADVNGDGLEDLILGAPNSSRFAVPDTSNSGALHIISGRAPLGALPSSLTPDPNAPERASEGVTYFGRERNMRFTQQAFQ